MPRAASAIGDHVLDLSVVADAGLFDGPLLGKGVAKTVFSTETTLNAFMALGRPAWRVRNLFLCEFT